MAFGATMTVDEPNVGRHDRSSRIGTRPRTSVSTRSQTFPLLSRLAPLGPPVVATKTNAWRGRAAPTSRLRRPCSIRTQRPRAQLAALTSELDLSSPSRSRPREFFHRLHSNCPRSWLCFAFCSPVSASTETEATATPANYSDISLIIIHSSRIGHRYGRQARFVALNRPARVASLRVAQRPHLSLGIAAICTFHLHHVCRPPFPARVLCGLLQRPTSSACSPCRLRHRSGLKPLIRAHQRRRTENRQVRTDVCGCSQSDWQFAG